MSSKDLSLLGLQTVGTAEAQAPESVTGGAAAARLVKPTPVSIVASAEALKICYRLLAILSEVAGTILVAGVGDEAATSRLAIQIAAGLAQVKAEKVLLVDADLRSSSVLPLFGAASSPGLKELLCVSATVPESLRQMNRNLFFLPAGNASNLDAAQFASPAFANLLDRHLRRDFRYVVIISPPFGERPDAHLLAAHCDGVVLAVQPGLHRREELIELNKELKAMDTKILGIVLIESDIVGE